MKKQLLLVIIMLGINTLHAQLLTPASGGSSKAMTAERIGITDVTVNYGRPAVKGREGKIWGGVVYTGYQNLGFGSAKSSPWRAGANENTTIEFSTDVMVDGHALSAGKYGLFIVYDPNNSTVIFSKATHSWGSYFYDEAEDVLRITVKPVAQAQSKERLLYEFGYETDSSAVLSLIWEKLAISFTISTELQKQQLAYYDNALRGQLGFDANNLVQIADYYNDHNVKLNEALEILNLAGQNMLTFSMLMTKAEVLEKLNKQQQADSTAKAAYVYGTVTELHAYGRKLLHEKKPQKAFEVFQYNYKHNPDVFTTLMGLTRGYSGIGKTSEALKYANKALPLAPDDANKKAVEGVISTLKEGKELSIM